MASGQTGETYVVEHLELKKTFAAKLLRAKSLADPRVLDRMRLEAQSLGRLRHPNVVSITGFERTRAGIPFIVTELLRGHTLADELRDRGALPVEEAIGWARQLLSALEAVHELGIVHRAICPHNLLLHTPKTGPRTLKVLDFGTARVLTHANERAPRPLDFPTAEGEIVGTPEFASPEVLSRLAVDPRSDLYQVGLVLQAMLSGRLPDGGDAAASPERRIESLKLARPPSADRAGGLDPRWDAVVLKALSQNPDERFRSATEFRLALEGLPTTPDVEPTPAASALGTAPARVRPVHRLWIFIALAVATAIATLGVGLLLSRWR